MRDSVSGVPMDRCRSLRLTSCVDGPAQENNAWGRKAAFPTGLYDDAVDSTMQALNCQIVILSVTPICALKIPGGIVDITFEGVTRLLWEGAKRHYAQQAWSDSSFVYFVATIDRAECRSRPNPQAHRMRRR